MKFLQSLCTVIALFVSVIAIAQDADQQQKNPNKGMEKILTPEHLLCSKSKTNWSKASVKLLKTLCLMIN